MQRIKTVFRRSVAANAFKDFRHRNGEPFTFHARGTDTEAIGNIIAKHEDIEFGQRSYVPAPENRIIAMMKGQITVTLVDLVNKNKLMEMAGDRFPVLPDVHLHP